MTTLRLIIERLSPTIDDTIATASLRVAQCRAQKVDALSGGAVRVTPEQFAAMRSQAAEDMYSKLREQLSLLFRVYATNVKHAPVE